MQISNAGATALLETALVRNYEPAINKAMPDAVQHEFDGAVSFHWNTGAISRASWGLQWKAENWVEARRREEEYALISTGYYSVPSRHKQSAKLARVVVPLDGVAMKELRKR